MKKTAKKTAKKTGTPRQIAKALKSAMTGKPPAETGYFGPSRYDASQAHHAFEYGAQILEARAAKAKDARTRRTLADQAQALRQIAKAFQAEGIAYE